MKRAAATIVREYGPFPGVTHVHGVSYDGTNVWIATGDTLNAIDTDSGKTVRALDVPARAGTAFDGRHLFQISEDRIQKPLLEISTKTATSHQWLRAPTAPPIRPNLSFRELCRRLGDEVD